MIRSALFAVMAVAALAGCAPEDEHLIAPERPTITLYNAEAMDSVALEKIRAFAQQELRVPVRVLNRPDLAGTPDFKTIRAAAGQIRTERDVLVIVIAAISGEMDHLSVDPENLMAAVNVTPLYTDDEERFTRRVERQVMRGAAFAIGLPPTPDPFCVTRDYRTVEDLDRMGRNYSPPWQGRFAEEAAKRGLHADEPSAYPGWEGAE